MYNIIITMGGVKNDQKQHTFTNFQMPRNAGSSYLLATSSETDCLSLITVISVSCDTNSLLLDYITSISVEEEGGGR